MKTIILAGGLGTRLSEETVSVPKPMVTVGGRPMLWHIMNIYASFGHEEFVVCLGYRGEVIKNWLLDLDRYEGSFTLDLATGAVDWFDKRRRHNWRVTALETGSSTNTGGRLKRALEVIDDTTVLMTYGDGVADVDITQLIEFHEKHGKLATVTAVRPPARFGRIHLEGDSVTRFGEKTQAEEGWINGGFFVLDRRVVDYIADDAALWEVEPLSRLATEGQLMAYRHEGFWQPMDTLRERQELERLWAGGEPPWMPASYVSTKNE